MISGPVLPSVGGGRVYLRRDRETPALHMKYGLCRGMDHALCQNFGTPFSPVKEKKRRVHRRGRREGAKDAEGLAHAATPCAVTRFLLLPLEGGGWERGDLSSAPSASNPYPSTILPVALDLGQPLRVFRGDGDFGHLELHFKCRGAKFFFQFLIRNGSLGRIYKYGLVAWRSVGRFCRKAHAPL